MRDESGGDHSSIMPGYPACRFIIFTTVLVFIAQIFLTREPGPRDLNDLRERIAAEGDLSELELQYEMDLLVHNAGPVSIFEEWFQLDTDKVLSGQVWRLITNAFLHDRFGVWHILINMLFLYWFGRELEERLGSREFLAFYLTAALLASVSFVVLQLYLGERIPAIGASGAVMAVVCLYTIYHPYHTINLFFLIPVQMRFLLMLYVVYDLHPLLLQLAGTPVYTGTAHAAHLGGLLFGYLYWKFNWHLSPLFDRLRLFGKKTSQSSRPHRRQRVTGETAGPRVKPVEKKLEADIDSILQKIHEQGEDSLTEQERQILNRGSEHYRNRE